MLQSKTKDRECFNGSMYDPSNSTTMNTLNDDNQIIYLNAIEKP